MSKQINLGNNWTAIIKRSGDGHDVSVLKGNKVVDVFATRGTKKQIIEMCKWSAREYKSKGSVE